MIWISDEWKDYAVLDASNSGAAYDKHYHTHFIKYEEFNCSVSDFMEEYGIA